MQKNDFSKALSPSLVNKRVLENRESLGALIFLVFLACYALDSIVGQVFGLEPFGFAVFGALVALAVIAAILVRDLTISRWKNFSIDYGEILFARNDSSYKVVLCNEEIRSGALSGFSEVTVVFTRPWWHHRFECLVGKTKVQFILDLELRDLQADSVKRWLAISEEDALREIRTAAQRLAAKFPQELTAESMRQISRELNQELNTQIFQPAGAYLFVAPVLKEAPKPDSEISLTV
jgi:hypothetical protein